MALGKGKGGDEWEGKGVAWRAARKDRKRKAREAKKAEVGGNAARAKRRRLAREAKAAETRTDDKMDEGTTTTPTDEVGTSNDGRSLPSLNIGGSPGAPVFQSSPIPSTSGVPPRLKKSKSFVFRREEGMDKTFIHRHHGVGISLPAPYPPYFVEQTPAQPVAPKRYEERKGAAAKERGGKRVNFYQDPNTPARKNLQDRVAAESRAALEQQRKESLL